MKKITKEDVKKFYKKSKDKILKGAIVVTPAVCVLFGYFIGKKVVNDNWVNILNYAMNKHGDLELTVLSDIDFWNKLLSEFENETLRKIKA